MFPISWLCRLCSAVPTTSHSSSAALCSSTSIASQLSTNLGLLLLFACLRPNVACCSSTEPVSPAGPENLRFAFSPPSPSSPSNPNRGSLRTPFVPLVQRDADSNSPSNRARNTIPSPPASPAHARAQHQPGSPLTASSPSRPSRARRTTGQRIAVQPAPPVLAAGCDDSASSGSTASVQNVSLPLMATPAQTAASVVDVCEPVAGPDG